MEIRTSINNHTTDVAADRSAAEVLLTEYRDELATLVQSPETTTKTEYGLSLAKPTDGSQFYLGGPTKGDTAQINVHVPADLLANITGVPVDGFDISPEPIRGGYADLIKVHTHPIPTDCDSIVGLSHGDLRDAVPGPDRFLRPEARRPPMEIYRAHGAIIYSYQQSQLSRDVPDKKEIIRSYKYLPLCQTIPADSKLTAWLHFIERTPAGVNQSRFELVERHYETLERVTGSPQQKFTAQRDVLANTVSELLIPLTW